MHASRRPCSSHTSLRAVCAVTHLVLHLPGDGEMEM